MDFPIKHGGSFHCKLLVYQAGYPQLTSVDTTELHKNGLKLHKAGYQQRDRQMPTKIEVLTGMFHLSKLSDHSTGII